jgi:hypothetical protein
MPRLLKRKAVRWVLIVLGSLALLAAAAFGVFRWKFIPSVPDADFPAPKTQEEAYAQDLTYLRGYADYEKALEDPDRRSRFVGFVDEALEDLGDMTPARFELLVSRAVALADNAHSNVSAIGRTRRVNHVGVRTASFPSGHYVLQATTEHAELLGSQFVSIEGHDVEDVLDSFVSTFGGPERRSRFFGHLLIASPQLLHADGFATSPDRVSMTFRLADGSEIERSLDALSPNEDRRQPFGREVLDYRVPEDDEGEWLHLMEGRAPPLALDSPDEPFWSRHLDEAGVYVRINYNYDYGGRSLTGWLDDLAAEMRRQEPRFAIVDLRFNGGGTDATAAFAKELPSLVAADGPIYVLTSVETFSAGIGAAAQFKEYGGRRTKIVGSLVGDRLRFVGNGGTPYVLPNSGISVRVWSTWEDYADGCWEWNECFWLSPYFRHPGVGDLDPDIPVVTTFDDYARGHDPLVAAALADFRGG